MPVDQFNLVPRPQEFSTSTSSAGFVLGPKTIIVSSSDSEGGMTGAELLQREIERLHGFKPALPTGSKGQVFDQAIVLGEPANSSYVAELSKRYELRTSNEKPEPEGYVLKITPNHIVICGNDRAGTFYGVQTLIQILRGVGAGTNNLPALAIRDWPQYPFRGMHLLSIHPDQDIYASYTNRGSASMEWLESEIAMMAHLKMNVLFWEVNSAVAYDQLPELSRSFTQGWDQARKVVDLARKYHIEVIPAFNSSSGHSNWMKPYDLMIDSDIYNEALKHIVDQLLEIFHYPRFFLAGLDEEARPPAAKLAHINMLRNWLAPRQCRLMIWGDTFLTGVGWTQEPARTHGQSIEQWAEQHIDAKWRKALDNLPADVIICNWRYASRTFETAEYFNWKGRDQVGVTWGPGGVLLPWFPQPEPWCLNFARFGHTMKSPHFLGLTGTTWYPYDWSFVRPRIIHSADAFWSPTRASWDVSRDYDPRLLKGITEPYTAEGHALNTPIPLIPPPAGDSHVIATPVVPDLATALSQLQSGSQDARTRAYIALARIGGNLPIAELTKSAQTSLDEKMAFWAAERMDLTTEESKQELSALIVGSFNPRVKQWAADRMTTLTNYPTPHVLGFVFHNSAKGQYTYFAANTTGTNPVYQGDSQVNVEKVKVFDPCTEYYYYVTSATPLISLAGQTNFTQYEADLFRVDKWYSSASAVKAPAGYTQALAVGMTVGKGASDCKFVVDGQDTAFNSEMQVHIFCRPVDPAQPHTVDFRYVKGPFGCTFAFVAMAKTGRPTAASQIKE